MLMFVSVYALTGENPINSVCEVARYHKTFVLKLNPKRRQTPTSATPTPADYNRINNRRKLQKRIRIK